MEELGNRTPWAIEKTERGSLRVMRRKNQNPPGRVKIGEVPEQRLIYVSCVAPAKAQVEERLTGFWIAWIIHHFSTRIATITVFPDKAKVGKTEET